MGRVEVCLDGRWGTVCGDTTSWGSNGALAVCRQLFGSDSGEVEFVTDNLAKGVTKCVCYSSTTRICCYCFYGEGNGEVVHVTCAGHVFCVYMPCLFQ